MACFSSTVFGASAGRRQGWGQESFEMSSSFKGVTVDTGYLLGPQCFFLRASMSFLAEFQGRPERKRERESQVEPVLLFMM